MADDTIQMTSLSLTHVYYDPTDPLSYLSAWLALVPQGLIVVYVTLAWSTREAEVLLAFAGQLGCEAVNFLLKRLIKEERPQHHYRGTLGTFFGILDESRRAPATIDGHPLPQRRGYGMPSSHAQFAGFWALTVALFLVVRHRGSMGRAARAGWSAVVFVVAFLIAGSRVYLHYHTPKQVAIGFAAGLVVGAGWFAATAAARQLGVVRWALQTQAAQYLRFRDLLVDEDVLEAGWDRWQEREKRRAVRAGKQPVQSVQPVHETAKTK